MNTRSLPLATKEEGNKFNLLSSIITIELDLDNVFLTLSKSIFSLHLTLTLTAWEFRTGTLTHVAVTFI